MSDITEDTTGFPQVIILTIALFLSYLTVAMALPAIPVHVVEGWPRPGCVNVRRLGRPGPR